MEVFVIIKGMYPVGYWGLFLGLPVLYVSTSFLFLGLGIDNVGYSL
jgi:uncharacterized glyoxalase superfamily metalloenzyme YdcJ